MGTDLKVVYWEYLGYRDERRERMFDKLRAIADKLPGASALKAEEIVWMSPSAKEWGKLEDAISLTENGCSVAVGFCVAPDRKEEPIRVDLRLEEHGTEGTPSKEALTLIYVEGKPLDVSLTDSVADSIVKASVEAIKARHRK